MFGWVVLEHLEKNEPGPTDKYKITVQHMNQNQLTQSPIILLPSLKATFYTYTVDVLICRRQHVLFHGRM